MAITIKIKRTRLKRANKTLLFFHYYIVLDDKKKRAAFTGGPFRTIKIYVKINM